MKKDNFINPEDFESLLDYKKASGDWHYDPMAASIDCQYVGRFDVNFSKHLTNVSWGKPETAVDIWEEDKLPDGTISRHKNIISWGKVDHISAGYTKENTKKYQLFNSPEIPDILYKAAEMSGLENYSLALFRQDPGQINPWHYDTFQGCVNRYKKQGIELTEDEIKKIKRYLIVLEDWDWGHMLQIGNNMLSQWRAGDIYTWEYGMYHTSANAGIKPKLTAHITGMPNKHALHLSGKCVFNIG
jgi:hypothetical protein